MAGFKTLKKRFTSWSNSRWNDYAQCPAKAHYKHMQKLPEPKSGPMDRGIQVAQMEEDFFSGKIKTLPIWPASMGKVESPKESDPAKWPKWTGSIALAKKLGLAIHANIAPLLKEAKKQKDMFFEENWGFSKDWKVVDYFDWNNCWLRVKVDVGWGAMTSNICHLRDNKTGKYSEYDVEKYMEQLRLYSAAGAAKFPHVDEFHVRLWFTDLGIQYPLEGPLVITRKEALALQKKFTKQVLPMFNDTRFDPTPNRNCRWCHYRKENGGPCKF